jgi:hypothetical protein
MIHAIDGYGLLLAFNLRQKLSRSAECDYDFFSLIPAKSLESFFFASKSACLKIVILCA